MAAGPHGDMMKQDTYEQLRKEEKQARKNTRVGIIAAFAGGGALAVFLLQKLFGGIIPSEGANEIVNNICLMLMGYAALMFVTLIFRKDWLIRVNNVMLFLVIPAFLFMQFAQYVN